jgi:hypothetical protein
MSLAGLDPTIPASEPPQTYALGRAATGIGITLSSSYYYYYLTALQSNADLRLLNGLPQPALFMTSLSNL